MPLRLISGPSETPVTLAEAKAHLRVEHTTDDTLITSLIAAVTAHLDGEAGWLGRALVTQTWELVLDDFPAEGAGEIRLPLAPLQSVTSIKYDDAALTEQTVSPDDYRVDAVSKVRPGWVVPGSSGWPSVGDTINAVRVRFVCGYGAASAVPAAIKAAMLLIIGGLYENREAIGTVKVELNPAAQALLAPYRVWAFG